MNTSQQFQDRISKLVDQIDSMTAYLLLKVQQYDWHGVADAAMDIRELERERRVLIDLDDTEQP